MYEMKMYDVRNVKKLEVYDFRLVMLNIKKV